MIQTRIMYVLECTCLYCDENHVVLLGILSNVSSKAQENNVHQKKKKCANNIILLSALAVLIYFWFSEIICSNLAVRFYGLITKHLHEYSKSCHFVQA